MIDRNRVPQRHFRVRSQLLYLWKAGLRWSRSDCVDFSAAFAYYALQSIFPLLLIALAVAAGIFGKTNGVDEVLSVILPLLPPSVGDLVESTLIGLVRQGFGAGLLGVVVLMLTASNLYLTLQRGADRLGTLCSLQIRLMKMFADRCLSFCAIVCKHSLSSLPISCDGANYCWAR